MLIPSDHMRYIGWMDGWMDLMDGWIDGWFAISRPFQQYFSHIRTMDG